MATANEKPRLLLVDFENVQQVELGDIDDSYRVIIFVGADQKNVPFDLVKKAQKLGNRVEWQKITGNGSNALDFFIAFQLGRVFDKATRPECVVLSKDKGFEPLLKFLNTSGMKSRRINALSELHHRHATAASTADPGLSRVVEVLGRSGKHARPRKRKTLSQAIHAMFQKKTSQEEVDKIIDAMFAAGLISRTHNIITYEF
ncbi:hypothetical protein JXD38_00185 [candidate division WOR-3 bacterium]|nr:hypothetical protein [candidate division WOR-3 bacterium]